MKEYVKDDELLCTHADLIDTSVYMLLSALAAEPFEQNMQLTAQVVAAVQSVMDKNQIKGCYPFEDENGFICYSLPDERCAHCTEGRGSQCTEQ